MSAPDTSFLLQEAVNLHQRGSFADARDRYAQIIRREPDNVDALYLCGLAQCQLGAFKPAIEHLRKALALAPGRADAHNTLSMALRELGQLEDALASSNHAIASNNRFAEAHANRGEILRDLGRPQDAIDAYDRALELMPNLIPALINRGSLLQEFGRHPEAIASYDKALTQAPSLPEAWLNRSKSLHSLGRLSEALASCDRAIAVNPQFAPAMLAKAIVLADNRQFDAALAHIDRALALQPAWPAALLERAAILHKKGDSVAALAHCERIIAANPKWFAAWQLRSKLLHDSARLDEAATSIERALALNPNLAEGHAWHGAMLLKRNRPSDAIVALDRALAIAPDLGTAHIDRGLALHAVARFEDAFAAFERGCRLMGDDPHVQFLIGLADLLHGRWSEGFRKYERRLDVPRLSLLHRRFLHAGSDVDQRFSQSQPAPDLPTLPRWIGEGPDGGPILIETEQGIGDAIQFARFAAHLASIGHRIHLLTLPILAPLLRTLPGIGGVITDVQSVESLGAKHWLPLMSVPYLLKATPRDIPFGTPYLSADPERVALWKARLGAEGFRIGIAWQGNSQNWLDAGRSVPLAAFEPIAGIPGVRLISLQKLPGTEQIDQIEFGDRIERVLDESDKSSEALLETAALLVNLDLVVTSDSMLTHLAGALGCKTFVALRRIPDWRWLLDRDDSPFYPTARLFRQRTEGDWSDVFARIADAVRAKVAIKAKPREAE